MRQKEIQHSTRAGTDEFKRIQGLRGSLANILAKLLTDLQNGEDTMLLKEADGHEFYNIIHLIYPTRQYENHSTDYEFSRLSII